MTSRVVCDASVMVAALLDSGTDGRWATGQLVDADLYAPTLLPFECANVIRRQAVSGTISQDQAAQAHTDMLDLPVNYWQYDALAHRIWALRDNLTSYDAAYVALAEEIEATLVTLDRRLQRMPGLRCRVACR